MKKLIIFLVVGLVLGAGLAGGGVYFMVQNGAIKGPEEVVEPEFDLKDGKRFTLEGVQIPLVQTKSKTDILLTDITLVLKTEEALALAEAMEPDIKDAIYGVFESKTKEELNVVGARDSMKAPIVEAVKGLYNNEEDKENIHTVQISRFLFSEI